MKIDVTHGLENVDRYIQMYRQTGDLEYKDKAQKLLSIIERLTPQKKVKFGAKKKRVK